MANLAGPFRSPVLARNPTQKLAPSSLVTREKWHSALRWRSSRRLQAEFVSLDLPNPEDELGAADAVLEC
jgi:hypothetical protein